MLARALIWICKVYFQTGGWQIIGSIPSIRKFIVIAGPHTSAWDIPIGIAAREIIGLKIQFMAKDDLFKFPFSGFMRDIGGIPVNRSTHSNMVDAMVEHYQNKEEFMLALAPEGTRSYVKNWKSGFFHIANKAEIPIICVGLDYSKKQIVIRAPYFIQGKNWQETETELKEYFKQFKGRHPEKGIY